MERDLHTLVLLLIHYTLTAAVIWRVLLRDRIDPPVRLAWVMVVTLLPVGGVVAYILFGEVRVRRADRSRARELRRHLRAAWGPDEPPAELPAPYVPIFAMGRATSGMSGVPGNRAVLLPEDDSAIEDMIAHVEAAAQSVHVLFYIWLPDVSGTRMAEALCAAARRGVICRVLVDDLGSRRLTRSALWGQMAAAGVDLAVALPMGNPLIEWLFKRLDLRNHRKIMVIDNRIAWSGSRNCADRAFTLKPRFAPWIDVLFRIEGPVVRQLQSVFLRDWMMHGLRDADADLGEMLAGLPPPDPVARTDHGPPEDRPEAHRGDHSEDWPAASATSVPADPDAPLPFVGQVLASGPDQRASGMSQTMCALLYAARRSIRISTPYFLPDAPLMEAICAAARRGVSCTLILPERNDSRIVAAASEGLYHALLRAGVRLHLFQGGLLHAKIMTVDGALAMIGSANLDRRSFDLNYENNLLVWSPEMTGALDARQDSYLERARPVSLAEVEAWSIPRRIRNNAVALAGPLL